MWTQVLQQTDEGGLEPFLASDLVYNSYPFLFNHHQVAVFSSFLELIYA